MTRIATLVPTEKDQQFATSSSRLLSHGQVELRAHHRGPLRPEEMVLIPARFVKIFTQIVNYLAQGDGITIIRNEAMLTTQDAADLLSVSRPFLIKLLGEHGVPIQRIGNRRRIAFGEIMKLKEKLQRKSRSALTEMVKLDEELGLE